MEKQKSKVLAEYRGLRLPFFVEKDEDGFYVVECPALEGCYAQGKTIDEALKSVREVIGMILEERESQEILRSYCPQELSIHTITL